MEKESNSSISGRDSVRVKSYGKFSLNFNSKAIFPLLCPVEEYKWMPGWRCEMIFSQTGVAEKDAIFLTKTEDGIESVETIINYDPYNLIEFLIVKGTDTVERLRIELKEMNKNVTELYWTHICTAYSDVGRERAQKSSNETFNVFLEDRKRELHYYLEHGKMIPE